MDLYQFNNGNLEVEVRRIAHGGYVVMRRYPAALAEWENVGQFSTRVAANRSAQQFVRGFVLTFRAAKREVNEVIQSMINAGVLDDLESRYRLI